MSWNRNNPHPPTSEFQVGDRVVVTKVPTHPHPTQNNGIRYGATGTVVWIAIKSGNPIVSMDEEFFGATQHLSIPSLRGHQWCFTFPNGEGLECIGSDKIEIDTLEDLM